METRVYRSKLKNKMILSQQIIINLQMRINLFKNKVIQYFNKTNLKNFKGKIYSIK